MNHCDFEAHWAIQRARDRRLKNSLIEQDKAHRLALENRC